MATATEPTTDPQVVAEEFKIATALIDPDPEQPRQDVDDELAASLQANGQLKAVEIRPHPQIEGRFMLVDGERRWRGAKRLGWKDLAAKFTLEVEGVSIAARLKRQIVHNQGKPLSPVEEAIAFKKIIDDERAGGNAKYGPVQLAKDLGLPKSTVTDRLAATEIPDFWLPFIVKGPLQSSHIPILHRWRKLPEKYQRRGLERLQQDHRWKGGGWDGRRGRHGADDRIHVGDFSHMLDEYFKSFTKPAKDVPGYKGPTEKMKDRRGGFYSSGQSLIAMDPSQWQPIARRKALDRAKKRRAAGGSSNASDGTPSWQVQNRKYELERQAEERRRKRWQRAAPAISAAFAESIASSANAPLLDFILIRLRDRFRHAKKQSLVAPGTTADQHLKHIAMMLVSDIIGDEWSAPLNVPRLAKRFKIDAVKLVKGADKEPEEPSAAGSGDEDDVDG